MTTPKTDYRAKCFVCARSEAGGHQILRFGLRMSWYRPTGKPLNRYAGGIYLCQSCWKDTLKVRPRRGPRPGYWAGATNVPGKKGFQPVPSLAVDGETKYSETLP